MLQGQIDLGITQYRTYSVALIVIGIAIVCALWLGFERTRMGAQIRAAVPVNLPKLALMRAESPPLHFYRYLYDVIGRDLRRRK